jgi:membrane-associated phospholipid phosphatase
MTLIQPPLRIPLANVVSISFAAGGIVPAALYGITGDGWYVSFLLWILMAAVVTEVLKMWLIVRWPNAVFLRRPIGASGCDILCMSGAAGGRAGFPSGHMTTATLLVIGLYHHSRSPLTLIIGIPWCAAMAWARYTKECHTLPQIAAGVLWGGALGALAGRVL